MRSSPASKACILALTNVLCADALSLDLSNTQSIKTAAQTIAHDLLGYYNGSQPGQIPGIFGDAIYWGEAGAIWGSLVDYWNYTGDAQHNSIVQQALLAQVGPDKDYMPPNQTKSEGNDDQGFWALAVMTAAEQAFPNPSTAPNTTWLDLAKSVFDLQVQRWDTEACGGGLRWQIFTFNRGYLYKNSISTGTFFLLAARLARYTGDQTYAKWAQTSYDWISSSSLINSDYEVYDGVSIDSTSGNDTQCGTPNKIQWTYNSAIFLYGSAVMYNFTNGDAEWQNRTQSFLSAMKVFTSGDSYSDSRSNTASNDGVLVEVACEPIGTCDNDQLAYKGSATQWLGATMQVAPFTVDTITGILQRSATGAAASCSQNGGNACGSDWTAGKHNEKTGIGQELSALNVILANLAANSSAPATIKTNPQASNATRPAATNGTSPSSPSQSSPITTSSAPSMLLSRQIVGMALVLTAAIILLFQ